ncbi:MAG: DUF5320 domain-containing protein, partial [Chloroflexota bacterium]
MPRGDKTGPEGAGPMTGRGAGYCAGSDRPGYAGGGFGRGRGFGRRSYQRFGGRPRRGGYGRFGYGAYNEPDWAPTLEPEMERERLQAQARQL